MATWDFVFIRNSIDRKRKTWHDEWTLAYFTAYLAIIIVISVPEISQKHTWDWSLFTEVRADEIFSEKFSGYPVTPTVNILKMSYSQT